MKEIQPTIAPMMRGRWDLWGVVAGAIEGVAWISEEEGRESEKIKLEVGNESVDIDADADADSKATGGELISDGVKASAVDMMKEVEASVILNALPGLQSQ
jgi:hypothetical protein